ncbi:hypothetical protein J7U37_15395 [Methylobacterium sp. 37f]|nr:hypothetical protein [Methylobacterium sp. 37f]
MSLHLAEISRSIAPRAHAVMMLDGAGWHDDHDVGVTTRAFINCFGSNVKSSIDHKEAW